MSATAIILLIAAYFGVLVLISYLTTSKGDNEEFFKANNSSPWYVVAFGMIGVSLSGVTYLSVPGAVETNSFSYLQMVLGNVIGYWLIMWILLPLYYKMNLTSIYAYLGDRFGSGTQKTGSFFFLVSRIIGASLRLYLVALVLQKVLCDPAEVPFFVTVLITIILVWVYTQKGGIKTIVWTDTLQTLFMLIGLFSFLFWLTGEFGGISKSLDLLNEKNLSQIFFFDYTGFADGKFFIRGFFTGIFITLVMNGLDQDMMQKNLTCRSLKDARKNMFSLSVVFLFVNICFVFLGGLLTIYAQQNGIDAHKDELFTAVAQQAPGILFTLFLLGVIAAAYSSADSALASLTTAFCVDFVDMDNKDEKQKISIRKKVHISFSVILFFTIILFKSFSNDSIVWTLFGLAGLTYGPLLGLYAFGLFTKKKVPDEKLPIIACIAPLISGTVKIIWGIGFEVLIYNGALTFLIMVLAAYAEERKK